MAEEGLQITVGASLDRSTLAVFSQMADAAKRATAQVVSAETKASRDREREFQQVARMADRWQKEEVRGAERAAKAKVAAEKAAYKEMEQVMAKAAKGREMAEKQTHDAVIRQLKDEARERKRLGEEQSRFRDRQDAANNQRANAEQRFMGRAAGGFISNAAGIGSRALRFAAGVGMDYARGIGVETSFGSIVKKNADLETQAAVLSNSAYQPGAKGAAGIRQDPNALMNESFDIGTKTGTGANDVMAGMVQFTKITGDLETGRALMERLAVLSKATGTNLDDMAAAAANASNQLGDMPNKAEVLDKLMRQIAGQGKLGAVEISDLAKQMAKVAAFAQQIEGDAGKNIQTLGIIAQESRLKGGSASASIAATSVQAMFPALAQGSTHRKWLDAGIADPISKTTGMFRDPEELIVDALKKKGTDKTAFQELFGGSKSGKAVAGFQSIFLQARNNAEGTDAQRTEAGIKAVRDEFERLRGSMIRQQELQESFALAMGTSQSKAEQWNNQIQQATLEIQSQLLPALAGLAPKIVELAGAIAKVLKIVLPEDPTKDPLGGGSMGVGRALRSTKAAVASGEITQEELNQSKAIAEAYQKDIDAKRAGAGAKQHVGWKEAAYTGVAGEAGKLLTGNASAVEYAGLAGPIGWAGLAAYGAIGEGGKYKEGREREGRGDVQQADDAQILLNKLLDENKIVSAALQDGTLKVHIVKNDTKEGEGADEGVDAMPATP